MKLSLKTQLERRTPALYHAIHAVRTRQYFRREFTRFHADYRPELFPPGTPITVQSGPFRGLSYLDEIVFGSIVPKWLGSYEAELHPVIQRIIGHPYATIIDVGCAEGYYAVGLAKVMPATRVVAFDTDFISRGQARRLARLNGVSDRVQVGALCRHADLDAYSRGETLVVCDIEGSETELLDPARAPSLRRNDLLVEIHESSQTSPLVEQLMQARFGASHRIARLAATDREAWIDAHRSHLPRPLSRERLRAGAEEVRITGRVWLWMEAHRD